MPNDSELCRILCELIDGEPEHSHRAETYTRLLWQLLDKQLFAVPKNLHWRRGESKRLAATA
jgi:hypothetical protein